MKENKNIIDRLFSSLAKYQKDNFGDNPEIIYLSEKAYKDVQVENGKNFDFVGLQKRFLQKESFQFCGIRVEYRRMANDIYCSNVKLAERKM